MFHYERAILGHGAAARWDAAAAAAAAIMNGGENTAARARGAVPPLPAAPVSRKAVDTAPLWVAAAQRRARMRDMNRLGEARAVCGAALAWRRDARTEARNEFT